MENLLQINGILLLLAGFFYTACIGLFTRGWYRPRALPDPASTGTGIKVSIIVSARNEEKHIGHLLADLKYQDYPPDLFEVIIVDDHSTDHTAKLVMDFITGHELPGFMLLKNEEGRAKGKKAAIDLGVKMSTGGLILTTDADCRIGPGWVSSLASYFADEDRVMVFGPVSYIPGKGLMSSFQELEFSALVASGAGAAGAGHPFMCNGACLAYRKSAFLQVNGFEGNENYLSGDDVFLLHKMKKTYGRKAIVFAREKEAIALTYPEPGLISFIKQRARWASKSRGYRDPVAAATAIIVFSFNMILAETFFTGFYHPVFFLLFAGSLLFKSLVDLPLVLGFTRFTRAGRLIYRYLPFQVVYPFYAVIAGILSLFGKRKW